MKPQVLKFYADWCSPCNQLAPVWDDIKSRLSDKFDFQEFDVVAKPEVQEVFNVHDLPTVLIMQDGQEKRRYLGFPQPLEDRLNRFLENQNNEAA